MKSSDVLVAAVGAAALLSPAVTFGAPSFEILGAVPGLEGAGQSVFDISADGRYATGVGGGTVFRWERGVGVNAISPTSYEHTFTASISADGSRIASAVDSDGDGIYHAAHWDSSSGLWTEAPTYGIIAGSNDVEGGTPFSLSADGSTFVGLGWQTPGQAEAASYNIASGTWTGLGYPSVGSSRASGVSGDGSITTGFYESETTGSRRAVYWDGGGHHFINSNTEAYGEGNAVSTDGRYVVGYTEDPNAPGNAAFIYDITSATLQTVTGIEQTFFGTYDASFNDISDNGIAVGYDGNVFFGVQRASIYTAETGLVFVRDYLSGLGLDMDTLLNYDPINGFDEWQITSTNAISADGTTIGGQMLNTLTYETRGWIATIPSPAGCGLLAIGLAWSGRRRRA